MSEPATEKGLNDKWLPGLMCNGLTLTWLWLYEYAAVMGVEYSAYHNLDKVIVGIA